MLNNNQLEWYGAMVYHYYFKSSKYKIIKFESPDFIIWQPHNNSGKIGLEISTPSTTTQNIGRKLSYKYFSKGLSLKEIQNRLNKSERRFLDHGEIKELHGLKYISYSKGMVNTSEHHKLICTNIRKKTDKLNTNYTLFNRNVLYLIPFSSFISNEEDIFKIKCYLNRLITECNHVFDEIIIDTFDSLVVYKRNVNKYTSSRLEEDSTIRKTIQEKCCLITEKQGLVDFG